MTRVTTERGLDRLVNFSDAVAAVAMTLLVLPLVDLVNDGSTLYDLFTTHGQQLVAYLSVFLLMIYLWSLHHRLWELIVDYDYPLMWMNAVWLLLLSLFPVFAGFEFENGSGGQALGYIALFALLLLVRMLMTLHVRSRDFMVSSDAEPDDFSVRVNVQMLGIYAVGIGLLAVWGDTGAGGWILGSTFLLVGLVVRLDHTRRVGRRPTPSDAGRH